MLFSVDICYVTRHCMLIIYRLNEVCISYVLNFMFFVSICWFFCSFCFSFKSSLQRVKDFLMWLNVNFLLMSFAVPWGKKNALIVWQSSMAWNMLHGRNNQEIKIVTNPKLNFLTASASFIQNKTNIQCELILLRY